MRMDVKNLAIGALAVLSAFLLGSLVGGQGEPAWAQQGGSSYANSTMSSNGRFIAATGSVGSGMSVLWVIDTESRRLVVYGASNLGKSVELRAARNIEWDLKLDEYNDDSQYKAEDLERLANRQKRLNRGGRPVKRVDVNAPGGVTGGEGSGGDAGGGDAGGGDER